MLPFDVGTAVGYLDLNTSGWSNGLKSAQGQLSGFNGQMSKAQSAWNTASARMTSTGLKLTAAVTTPIIGLGAKAVKTSATFESAMSQVQATMGVTADSMDTLAGQTVNTMGSLSDLAKELGASTKFSAVEAAQAINNMAMAGYNVQEIYDSLPQVLSLASAGALDLDYATQLVANGLNVMGMGTEDATELADKLAVTSTKAYGSVSDFGEGLLVAGAQAKLANVSLTDTMTALGILGDNGISASEGGTYLRNTLKNLYTPTEKAADALHALGVTTANEDGTLRDFQDVLQDLGGALDGLTEDKRIKAMSDIFDSRTISAANALIKNSGERWDELSGAIDGASGSAEKMADTQLNNLDGQLTILKSSLEGLAIAFGSLIMPLVKEATAFIQRIVDYLNGLDEAQKQQLLKIAAIVAAIGPALIILGKVMSAISGIGRAISLILSPASAVIAVVGVLVAAFIHLWNTSEDFRNSIIETWNRIKDAFQSFCDSFVEKINSLGYNFKDMTEVLKAAWDWFCETLGPVFEGVFKVVADVIEGFLGAVLDVVDIIIAIINGDWSAAWEGLKNLVSGVWDAIVNALNDFLSIFGTSLEQLWASITGFFENVWNKIVEFFAGIWNSIVSFFTGIVDWVNKHVIQPVTKFFSGLWNGIKNGAKAAWNAIKGVWNAVTGWFNRTIIMPIKNAFKDAWDTLKNGAKAAWDGIKSVFVAIPNWFKSVFKKAWQAVKDVFATGGKIFEGIKDGIVSAFKAVVNAIIKGINKVIAVPFNAINKVLSKLKGIKIVGVKPFGWVSTFNVPQIPLLAKGGVLKRGQVGLLEGDGAEAVVPLEQNTEWIKRISSELFDRFKALLDDSGLLKSLQTFAMSAEDMIQAVRQKGIQAQKSEATINNYYNFYSPKEIDPIQARKMMLQTAQQLALD